MKKISILIIGLLAILFASNVTAQKAGGPIPISLDMDLQIRFEFNIPSWPSHKTEIIVEEICTPSYTTGTRSVTIDGSYFTWPNNYTCDCVTVRIYVSKEINGVWTRYKTARVVVNNIFYYDYPIEGNLRVMHVPVRLENMEGPN